ncbi:membrane protein [Dyadobacter beijingensis]|uniref:Membrane protein n=1 Tax=Dyadobacter beijingensis TaxID=365489 RepID=A0ABQ2I2V8_9BACT|nr:membrane protein [Dyadobacter beijingensis]
MFARQLVGIATILLVIYPAWDVVGTILDIRAHRHAASKIPQYVNAVISVITTIAVGIALQKGIPETLIVFGIWAILTGLIQLVLGVRRRRLLGGQWPMIISGGQSVIGGSSFILLAHDPTMGISSLAGYAAFGAFYYLLSAFRLSKTANQGTLE